MYNQEGSICQTFRRLEGTLNRLSLTYEIIIVNDGSTDNTFAILKEIEKLHAFVKVIGYGINKGKGYAVKKGVECSSGEFVMFLDGDLDIPPETISNYIEVIQSYDIVIASKRHPSSTIAAPVTRKFLSKVFALVVRFLLGLDVKDTQTGLKAGYGWLLRLMFQSMTIKRYAFDVELLTLASKLNLTIKEMPVEVTIDRQFKIKEIITMSKDVCMVYWRYRKKAASEDFLQLGSLIRTARYAGQIKLTEALNEKTADQLNVEDQKPVVVQDLEPPVDPIKVEVEIVPKDTL